MKVFISWAKDESREFALALRNFLADVLPGLKVFMSEHDIEGGTRWSARLAEELQETNFGLFCLTPGALRSEWLIFEAGALTKLGGRAFGLMHRVSPTDVAGPLTQFQHKPFGSGACRSLVDELNQLSASPREHASLARAFDKFWPDLRDAVNALPPDPQPAAANKGRRMEDVLEELVTRVRNVERFVANIDPEHAENAARAPLREAGLLAPGTSLDDVRRANLIAFDQHGPPSGRSWSPSEMQNAVESLSHEAQILLDRCARSSEFLARRVLDKVDKALVRELVAEGIVFKTGDGTLVVRPAFRAFIRSAAKESDSGSEGSSDPSPS